MAPKLNEQATCRGMATAESEKFQSPILPDWCIASMVCSYSVDIFLRISCKHKRHRNLGESGARYR